MIISENFFVQSGFFEIRGWIKQHWVVTKVTDEMLGGVKGGVIWEVQAWLERLIWSLWILSQKNLAKDWERDMRLK